MTENKSLDIVLPSYNSQRDWYQQLLLFYDEFKHKYKLNFIIVNDGSTNNNFEAALHILKEKQVPFSIISYSKNKGKGYALRQGVFTSKSEYTLYTDIDFPFTNRSMKVMIELLFENNFDVIVGIRDEAYYQNKMTIFRKYLSKTFRFILKSFFKMKITDTQCGLKAFTSSGKKAFLKTTINRYLFDFEFIYFCSKNKDIRIRPIQVELKDNVVFSKMKFKILLQEIYNLFKVIYLSKS